MLNFAAELVILDASAFRIEKGTRLKSVTVSSAVSSL